MGSGSCGELRSRPSESSPITRIPPAYPLSYFERSSRPTHLGLAVILADGEKEDFGAYHAEAHVLNPCKPIVENANIGKLAVDFNEVLAAYLQVPVDTHPVVIFILNLLFANRLASPHT